MLELGLTLIKSISARALEKFDAYAENHRLTHAQSLFYARANCSSTRRVVHANCALNASFRYYYAICARAVIPSGRDPKSGYQKERKMQRTPKKEIRKR